MGWSVELKESHQYKLVRSFLNLWLNLGLNPHGIVSIWWWQTHHIYGSYLLTIYCFFFKDRNCVCLIYFYIFRVWLRENPQINLYRMKEYVESWIFKLLQPMKASRYFTIHWAPCGRYCSLGVQKPFPSPFSLSFSHCRGWKVSLAARDLANVP